MAKGSWQQLLACLEAVEGCWLDQYLCKKKKKHFFFSKIKIQSKPISDFLPYGVLDIIPQKNCLIILPRVH
ncbi:hypothetical protein L1987_25300 [Smallanthus sonchifolius]|uniref:Uncharacterized protein n=1 Tax=Smallanthus sonchifolius TaxID=185202 RepID=A0ACB9IN06_9ASTR|nr:hypothetical protein L1987_25300 [Smallanthus sonchifolius]